ncbi:MAG: tyrosine-type recombinase/integrase, partial [Patescibacteria group bacterium]
IALRSFLKYLSRNDIETLAPEKITLAKQEERQVSVLEEDELEKFLEGPMSEHPDHIVSIRDKAILETLFSTGLRVSELAALRRDELNLKKDEHTVRGKGRKLRLVFFSNTSRQWIAAYLQKRRDSNSALFVRHDRASSIGKNDEHDQKNVEALTPRSIQRIVQFYARLAGITKRITPHTLRHTYATDLLMNGADIRSVQSLLGHASITTTQIYTHITNRQLKDVYHAFHDRNRKVQKKKI